ncbi:hypothetical protein [Mammaliicoccus sciuri]|uniref:hypothetical protein n=1 Tax=Mammaliicoccus sciuri TaxID=1296 RepID=UPI0018B0A9DD|nr:hypothetical protein [Mammaliicoccus sciuri]MBF9298770.1 hypothetical protein [Staphylococcus schleiferi]MDO0948173.1 hypothetical protein [Mammaliicoccus sciuri]MDO0953456.1 hypothetical protein [Mammaliicoccus sciuri]
MKKLLVLLFASLLVLGACGEKKEESSSKDDTKETKKEVKKEEPKKKESDKDKTKKEKESAKKAEPKTEESTTEEVNTTEQPTQEQAPTKEEMAQKFKNGENVNGQIDNEGNQYVQAQGGGDAMGYYKPDGSFCTVGGCVSPEAQARMDRETENVQEESNSGITAHEDGRQTYKDELGHDKNILTPEEEARQAEENDITPEEREEVLSGL